MRRIVYTAVCSILLASSCSYYESSLLSAIPSGLKDAGDSEIGHTDDAHDDRAGESDAPNSDGETGVPQACESATWPRGPEIQNAGGDIAFVVAMKSVDLGDTNNDAASIGYNIDGRCSCEDKPLCRLPTNTDVVLCDAPGGRDNAIGLAIAGASFAFSSAGFGSSAWTQNIMDGRWSVLFRISGYNGEPDDDQVLVEWFIPDSFSADKAPDAKPEWNGSDQWPILESSLEYYDSDAGELPNIDAPRYKHGSAFVSNYTLVSDFPTGEITIPSLTIELDTAFMTARIAKKEINGETRYYLTDGLIGGSWPVRSLLSHLGGLIVFETRFCPGTPYYKSSRDHICQYLDIASSAQPTTNPVCDALSAGLRFETEPAELGTITSALSLPDYCPGARPSDFECVSNP